MTECIDVRTIPGRYRIGKSADHEPGANIDPWNLEILCKHGRIYPHGGSLLQAWTDGTKTRLKLAVLPNVKIHQWGDLEATFVFDVADLLAVFEVMKPRRLHPGDISRLIRLPNRATKSTLKGENDPGLVGR